MEIVTGINPNCSESTVRIKLDDVDEKIIYKLREKLELECYGNSRDDNEWDDDNCKGKEYDWYETDVSLKIIFGIKIMEIHGDAPYNKSDEVEKVIHKFIKNPEIEYSEG